MPRRRPLREPLPAAAPQRARIHGAITRAPSCQERDDASLVEEAVRLIAQEGEDPNERAWDGETALMAACMLMNPMLVSALLAHGADPGLLSSNGSSALSAAAFSNNVPAVRMLLRQGGEGVRRTALLHGLDRLIATARMGLMVMKLSPIWWPGWWEVHPGLLTALLADRSRLLHEELAGWFRQNAPSHDGAQDSYTAAAAAEPAGDSRSGYSAAGQPISPLLSSAVLMRLVEKGDVARLRQALELGANPNTVDQYKRTLLMHAASHGQSDVARLLLSTGSCALEHRRLDGWTALHEAADSGHLAVLQQLIDAGCDVNARDYEDITALMCASHCGYTQLVSALVAAGADVDAVDHLTATALHEAAGGGHCEVIAMLLDAGADINKPCITGTALVVATKTSRLAAVQLLLSRGADPNILDMSGYTALSWAESGDCRLIRKSLLQAGGKLRDGIVKPEALSIPKDIHADLKITLLPQGRRLQARASAWAAWKAMKVAPQGTYVNDGFAQATCELTRSHDEAECITAWLDAEEAAELMAAQLVAQEQEEKAKVQAAQAKRGHPARQRVKMQSATGAEQGAAGGRTADDKAEGTTDLQQKPEQQAGSSADASSSRTPGSPSAARPHDMPSAQASALQMAGLSLGTVPALLAHQRLSAASPSPPTPVQQQQQPCSRQGRGRAAPAAHAQDDERCCVVCMDRPCCMVLVPCGHVVLCATCCKAVEAANNECPMCRAGIDVAVALKL